MSRLFPAALFLVLLLAALAGAPGITAGGEGGSSGGYGQEDSTRTNADSLAANPDSAEVDEGAARRSGQRFSPTYTSGYQLNRNIRTWSQNFNVSSWAGPVDLGSATVISITKDNTLNRDRRNRNTNFTFGYKLPAGLKLGSTLGLIRDQTIDGDRVSSSQESERFNLTADYVHELVTGLTGTFRAAGGTSRDHRDDPLTSSRESTGPQVEGSAEFGLTSFGNWTLRTLFRNSRLNSTEDRTGLTTRDNNLTGEASMNWDFSVPGFNTWSLSIGRRMNRLQYPILVNQTNATQETNTNRASDVSLSTSTSPFKRLTLSGSTSYRNNNVDRDVDVERSQESIDRAANWKLEYQFGDSTAVELHQDWSIARSLFDDPGRATLNGNIRSRALGGLARRPIGSRTKVDIAGNYQIQSFEFDDLVSNVDDRDIVRGDFSSNVEYLPMPKIKSTLRFNFQQNQTIFIDASRSQSNQTQQIFTVLPGFEYKLNSRITFREDGSAIANATVIDFDEDQNRLSRSTELRSTIDTKMFPRLGVNLRHSWRFLQDGSYRRAEDGIRRFAKSRDDTSRDLTFRIDYTPMAGINTFFRANKRLTDTVSRSFRAGRPVDTPSSSEFNEIQVGNQITYRLKMGMQITTDLQRFQNWDDRNSRTNYWLGSINVTHQF